MINTARYPSLPPFKCAGVKLWCHHHSRWESITGKAGKDSVEFCHLCSSQETEGGASIATARSCSLHLHLDLDPGPCSLVCSLMDNTEELGV